MTRGWVVAVVLGAACHQVTPTPPAPASLDAMAERYVRAALQLAQHNPGLVESWRGPQEWRPGPRTPVKPMVEAIEALERDLEPFDPNLSDADRHKYLWSQVKALHVAGSRLLGIASTFEMEAHTALGVQTPWADPKKMAAVREKLAVELAGPQPLSDRLAAFKGRFVVPPARAERVFSEALAACRAVTRKALALPDDERVEVEFVSGMEFDGAAEYLGDHRTVIRINRDAALDVTRALHLACHEGYPGHHVQSILIDDILIKDFGWKEFLLTPAFGSHLLMTEGAAEAATALAFPPAARVQVYRDRLLPAAGLPAGDVERLVRVEELVDALEPLLPYVVGAYLDNVVTRADAVSWLHNEALLPDPESLLSFGERWRTRVITYPIGRELVGRNLEKDGIAGLKRFFAERPFAIYWPW